MTFEESVHIRHGVRVFSFFFFWCGDMDLLSCCGRERAKAEKIYTARKQGDLSYGSVCWKFASIESLKSDVSSMQFLLEKFNHVAFSS